LTCLENYVAILADHMSSKVPLAMPCSLAVLLNGSPH